MFPVEKVVLCSNKQFREPVHMPPLNAPVELCQAYGFNVCYYLLRCLLLFTCYCQCLIVLGSVGAKTCMFRGMKNYPLRTYSTRETKNPLRAVSPEKSLTETPSDVRDITFAPERHKIPQSNYCGCVSYKSE